MFKKTSFTIIGPGRLGAALLDGLDAAGYPVESVYTRSEPGNDPSENHFPGKFKQGLPETDVDLGELIFLTTPDDVLSDLAEKLAAIPGIEWGGRNVIHCSGSLSSEVLASLGEKGAQTASFHPLQTFTGSSDRNTFRNIAVSIEGGPEIAGELEEIAESLWSNPVRLSKHQKQVLHVAAVFVSNYTVALGEIADGLIREEISGQNFEILKPLLKQTADNMIQQDLVSALTGPVARGDVETVRNHLEVLREKKEYLNLYKSLGKKTLELSIKKNIATDVQVEKLSKLFTEDS